MSETNETEDKAARGGSKMTLNVRRTVESGHVRQSFSHGRSKSVLVEKKKRRSIGSTPAPQPVEEAQTKPKPQIADAAAEAQGRGNRSAATKGQVLRQLSDEEKDARTRALYDARQREADEQARAIEFAAVEVAARGARGSRRSSSEKVAAERKVKEDAAP